MSLELKFLIEKEGVPLKSYNDAWYRWLGDQGYEGAWNERWVRYAADRGVVGAYPDVIKKLFCDDLFNTGV